MFYHLLFLFFIQTSIFGVATFVWMLTYDVVMEFLCGHNGYDGQMHFIGMAAGAVTWMLTLRFLGGVYRGFFW
jgi:hypothetical protein